MGIISRASEEGRLNFEAGRWLRGLTGVIGAVMLIAWLSELG